jgi:hypothetical protein
MTKHRIYAMSFASVNPLYVAKAAGQGRPGKASRKDELNRPSASRDDYCAR